jgi:hypothetical protein
MLDAAHAATVPYSSTRLRAPPVFEGAIVNSMFYSGSVSNYSIQVSPSTFPGWAPPQYAYTRVVVLNPIDLSGGGSGLAFLYFVPDGRPVTDSSTRAGTANPVVWDLFLPMDDYAAIIDVLRNEQPISFFFNDATPDAWALSTGEELVGEDWGK